MIEEVISPSKNYQAGDSDLVLGVEGLPLLDILTTKREKKTVNNLLNPLGYPKNPKNPLGYLG